MRQFSFTTKTLSKLSLTCLTALTLLTAVTKQANAAIINFDSNKYEYSNSNTCTPQLPSTGGKCFVEDGFKVEAFSAQETGSPSAFFSEDSHFHASDSYEAQHYSGEDALLGVYLTQVNGNPFSLESLDYQLRETSEVINGFPSNDIKMLISPEFDPTQPVGSQFTEISLGNNTDSSFETLAFSDFDNINQVYLASSAGVDFDNVNVQAVPEPLNILGSLTALGIGVVLKGGTRNKSKKLLR